MFRLDWELEYVDDWYASQSDLGTARDDPKRLDHRRLGPEGNPHWARTKVFAHVPPRHGTRV